jgi:hypothetical protein
MKKEDHIKRYTELHKSLDELVADWITHTRGLPSKSSIFDLMMWSSQQCDNPSPQGEEKK